MIYLFSGDDANKKILVYEKFIKSIPQEVQIFSVSRNNFDQTQMESFYSGANLFSPLSALLFQGILEYKETRDFVLEKLNPMGNSANLFIFLEGRLNKPILDAFKKAKAEVNIFELPKEKKEKYDNFLIANAFADKNKLNTWIYFRQAIDVGVSLEEIVGVLFWKTKDLLLRKNFSRFTEKQLKDFSTRLSYLLPEARKKGQEAEAVLEQFLLEAF